MSERDAYNRRSAKAEATNPGFEATLAGRSARGGQTGLHLRYARGARPTPRESADVVHQTASYGRVGEANAYHAAVTVADAQEEAA